MKKYKTIITIASSFMAILIVLAPFNVSYATNGKNENGRGKGEQHNIKLALNAEHKSNSIWNRFGLFFGKKVSAEVAVNVNPVISGIKAPTVLKVGEMGTWSIKASDKSNGSLSYSVDWGDNAPSPFAKMAPEAFVQTSTFTHAYANKGVYNIKFTVENDAGLKATSTVNVNVRGESASAPVISNLLAESKKPSKATITWSTDVKASNLVWYSKVSPIDTNLAPNISRLGKNVKHKINLNNLEANTKYYVVVGSESAGGKTLSSEISFTTPALPNSNPVITSLSGPSTIMAGEKEIVTVNAYDPKNGSLSYSVDWGDNVSTMRSMSLMKAEPVFVQSSTFEHVYTNAGVYTATFTVENDAGLKTTSSIEITVTMMPTDNVVPVISNLGVSAVGISGSTISWKTDEPSTSKIYYSSTSPVDTESASAVFVSDDSLVTEHSMSISGLNANTLYHFIVVSADSSKNTAKSSESMFATL